MTLFSHIQLKNKTTVYGQQSARLELPGVGEWGLNPSSCLQTLTFESKLALKFNPWAKFQTFRHLTPSSYRSIPTLSVAITQYIH